MGYLLAIRNGATIIYDTDDLTIVSGSTIPVLDKGPFATYAVNASTTLINVYNTYGLVGAWPRGLPILHAVEEAPTIFERHIVQPLLQQGVPGLRVGPCLPSFPELKPTFMQRPIYVPKSMVPCLVLPRLPQTLVRPCI